MLDRSTPLTRSLLWLSVAGIAVWSCFGAILSDEVFSLETAALPLNRMMDALRGDVHPPLYYLVLKLWLLAAPENEFGLRSLSAAAYALCAWLLTRIGMGGGEVGRLAAAAVFAGSPLAISMAGYGRMYTLLGLMAALSLLLIERLQRQEAGRNLQLALAAAVCAGLLLHHWFAFFLFSLLAAAWLPGPSLRRALPGLLLGLASYGFLWLPELFQQIQARSQQLAWLAAPQWSDLGGALLLHLAPVVLLLPLFALFVFAQWRKRGIRPALDQVWLLAAAGLCFLVPFILSQWKPVFNARFTIIAAPLLALFIGRWMTQIAHGLAVWLILSGNCLVVLGLIGQFTQCNSRTAAELLKSRMKPGDIVVFSSLTRKPIEWEWRKAAPQGVEAVSLPSATDHHPGYEEWAGTEQIERELGAIEARAKRAGASSKPTSLYLVVNDTRPAAQRAEARFRAVFSNGEVILGCPDPGKHYFNRILVFRP